MTTNKIQTAERTSSRYNKWHKLKKKHLGILYSYWKKKTQNWENIEVDGWYYTCKGKRIRILEKFL